MNIDQIINFIQQNLEIVWFYLPLGIIGVWRWGVWVFRKIVSVFYRVPDGKFQSTISVVTPVYNENPKLFRRALDSWANNKVDEIVAVIDYTDKTNIEIFENFSKNFSGAKLIVTEKPGKRPALADGIRASQSEIVALVDSDTVWSPNIKNKLLGPFSDSSVGGLVTRQDVFETDTLARKLFKILLDDRYLLEYPFLATVSDALLCLSGRTAVYRRVAISDKLDELVNETFWGKPMISGDDKTLTRLIHKEGWKSRYVGDVSVYTSGVKKMSDFMRQKLRWTRNGLRSDSKVLFSGWVWKNHKMLALHMLDKFVSPITLLLAPIYFAVSLFLGHWQVALIILVWWLASRAVKLFPHFKEKPGDVYILPVYILMTFVMAVVKVYALITIDEQGWITRWDKSRLATLNFFKRTISYAATASLMFALFFVIFTYKNQVLIAAQAEKARLQAIKEAAQIQRLNIFTLDKPRLTDEQIENVKIDLVEKRQDDPYGYYVVGSGDTIPILRWKFNLAGTGRILDARTKRPLSSFAPLRIGQQIAISVEELRNPISRNIVSTNPFFKFPRINYDAPSNTIFVRQSGSTVTLSQIRAALGPARQNLLQETASGEWVLRANLYIGKSVILVVDGNNVKELKLKSDPGTYIWVRSEGGSMLFIDTRVTSWDETTNSPDVNDQDGRSYVTAKNSGRMDIINSDFGYLGSAGSPKRGGLFGGSYGVSWKIKSNGLNESLLTGVVTGNKFHNNYFGFYTFGVTGMLVRNNSAYENVQYGFDPHDDSNNMLIENNQAYNNGNHGIILSRRCFDNVITGNVSHDNRLHGIMLDRQSNNNLVQGNTVYGNVDGIALYDSSNNLILENEIKNNVRGIRMNAGSSSNYSEKNNLLSNERGVYIYDLAKENLFFKNQIRNSDIGVTIKNASQNQLFDNFETLDNKRDGRITADSYENNIQ